MNLGPLYPILNLKGSLPSEIERIHSLAVAIVASGGVRTIQLRAKDIPTGVLVSVGRVLRQTLERYTCRLIINDRLDVALACQAAGVHLGKEDLSPADARRVLGPRGVIGYSTHDVAEVAAASEFPVNYLGFGPVFESPTKAGTRIPRGIAALAEACQASAFPVVAIGGVTSATALEAWKAGAHSVAVISELERNPDPAGLARTYQRLADSLRPTP